MPLATAVRPDQAPIAFPRSTGTNVASRMARLRGVSRAAPTPCSARAPINAAGVGARAYSSDATANQRTPVVKTRWRRWQCDPDHGCVDGRDR